MTLNNQLRAGVIVGLSFTALAAVLFNVFILQKDDQPMPPGGLQESETVIGYQEFESERGIQREWEIFRQGQEPRELIQLSTIPIEGERTVANINIALAPSLREYLLEIVADCSAAIADPVYFNDPDNNQVDPDSDIGSRGMTEVEWCQAQVNAFTKILDADGGVLNDVTIKNPQQCPNCTQMLFAIRDSFRDAVAHTFFVAGVVPINRAEVELAMSSVLVAIGEEALVQSRPEPGERYVLADYECYDGCTQFLRPISDQFETNFTELVGDGDGDHYDELDESISAGDGNQWESASNPDGLSNSCVNTGGDAQLKHDATTGLDDPVVHTGHEHQIDITKNTGGGRQIDAIQTWCQGTTAIGTLTTANIDAFTNQPTLTLTTGEAANITDYDAIDFFLACDTIGGGPGRTCRIDISEGRLPDAPVAGPRRIFIVD